ncbi:MAG: glycosyltransferase N-terminal domain-containing protein [Deltaproteobacteria bacterium]
MARTPTGGVTAARLAGAQLARFIRFVERTSDIVAEPVDILERLRTDHPCIVAIWHGQFMMSGSYRPDVPVAAMVARHRDAELIGTTMEHLGVELVRGAGSAGRKKDRGGASALRAALQCLGQGKSFVMTADVPPGPARRCGEGIVTLARLSGRPIVPLAAATSRFKSLDTWSRLTINLPYSRLAFVYGDPIFVPRDASAQMLEALRQQVEHDLNAVTRRAYQLAGADVARATPRSADLSIPPSRPGLALKTYKSLTRALAPFAPFILDHRERRGKEDAARRPERLGIASRPRPAGLLAWVHAASVGEFNAVLPLIERLAEARPDLHLIVTTGTVTSAAIAAARLPQRSFHQYAPIDTPQAVKSFLDHWQPDLAIFTESDIWPNIIMSVSDRHTPMALVNARMSGRSSRRWRRRRRIAQQLFGRFAVVLAQNAQLARHFALLGAPRTLDAGNLKVDAPAPPVDKSELARLKGITGDRPLLIAASTHDGEELLVAQAHRILRQQMPDLLTIIAPRHPGRGGQVAAELAAAGFDVTRRSTGTDPAASTDIYLADTIGELGLFYSLGEVVFLGGSLVPRGGQNPIEAIRLGCAVMSGPHHQNFAEIYGRLQRTGAVAQVGNSQELATAALRLLTNQSAREEAHRAADGVLQAMGGALEKSLAALLPLLPAATAPPSSTDENEPAAADAPATGLRRALS